MNSSLRWFLRLTFLASVAVLLALTCGLGRRGEGSPLRFERDPFVVPEAMQSLREYDYEAVVINESRHPVRVVGAGDYCGSCCYSGRGLPTVIEAGARGHLTVRIKTGMPGNFSGDLTFYTDQPSQPTFTVRLAGTVRGVQPVETEAHPTNP